MSNLKPVSTIERDFLAAIGETPAEHQKQLAERFWKKSYGKAHATEKRVNVHDLNRDVERRLTSTDSAANIVKGLKVSEILWIPDAYILFVRKWKCDCGATGSCLDQPYLFLRQHRDKKRDPDNAKLYVPVRAIESPTLPRLKEIRFAHLHICENCLETAQCQSKPSPSVPADIVSCGAETKTAETLSELLSPWLEPSPQKSSMVVEASDGLTFPPGPQTSGSSSESLISQDSPASALDSLSPTSEPSTA